MYDILACPLLFQNAMDFTESFNYPDTLEPVAFQIILPSNYSIAHQINITRIKFTSVKSKAKLKSLHVVMQSMKTICKYFRNQLFNFSRENLILIFKKILIY